jgi:thioredoxin reductase
MAELSRSDGVDRPFPPGDYPVIVIGSGAGALQTSYSLRHLGIDHAVLSQDDAPGGMFRRWPFFQRLLSWTKPHAPVERGTRAYERYDWNSLLGEEPATRAIQPELMDGSSYFPSRPEMERNLATFADRARLAIRYGCEWTGTSRASTPDGDRFTVETTDGAYTCTTLVVAVGVARPRTPPGPGMELSHHYADVRPAESYAGHRVFIAGKQNSGFELANGLLPWACQVVLASPSHAKLSVVTNSLVGVRARYVQPYEDAALGGGVSILDAAIDRVERVEGGDGVLRVLLRRTDGTGSVELEVDDVISATGFDCPLVDLPALGVATFGASALPAQTSWWESTTVPGIFFAGTIGQGSKGLQRHGMPSNSGAVHGARYNARLLAGRIATTRHGRAVERPPIAVDEVVDLAARELADCPELWHQKGYLARVITVDPTAGLVDDGVQPLTHWLDAGADGVALTLEADGSGAIYPALFARKGGALTERTLDPDPLLRYDTAEVRRAVADLVEPVIPGARATA